MSDVILYGFAPSTYVRTARLACEEKGVTHALEAIELGSPAHRALHPFARMPAMRHGDFVLYETSAIARYVDETFEGPALQPAAPRARARMNQWISAVNDYYYQALARGIVLPRIVYPMRGRSVDEAAVAAAVEQAEQYLGVADATLAAGPYLAGDALSLADLFLGPIVFWLEKTPEGARLLPRFPAVRGWYDGLAARPSFVATAPPIPQQTAAD
jgi:glutathione S-transferase